jgi:O-antigen/teichoic acid export membrane protein
VSRGAVAATFMMLKNGSVWRNAMMAIGQVVVTSAVLFVLYRYLLNTLGAVSVGIWALVLATTSASRISELGLAGSAIKFVAAANARKDFSKGADVVQTALLTIGTVLAIVLIAGFPLISWLLALIMPAVSLPDALKILPYALASVWLSGTGGVVLFSLDGCQRADLRAAVFTIAVVVFLLLVLALTPAYGLVGLGMAQVCQSLFIMVVSWVLLRRQMSALPPVPLRWRFSVFREMFRYGLNFQVISIFSMLYEPLTKAFLTKFGGLSVMAYFEMANRMVLQLRALVVAANQVLVPKIAAVHETSPGRLFQLYRDSYRVVFFLAAPLFALSVAAVPLIGFVWIGHEQSDFVFFGVVITLGYLINTLSAPAYFMNLGIGALRWNVVAHVVLGLLTAALGYVLGKTFGGWGAVIGSVTALIIASTIIVWGTHRDQRLQFHDLVPHESRWLLLAACAAITSRWVVAEVTVDSMSLLFRHVAGLLAALLILTPVIWKHPVRVDVWTRMLSVCSRAH